MYPKTITTGGEFPSREQLAGLGELCFLLMRAANFQALPVARLRAALEPAVDTGHFAIMRQDGVPRAAITWAFLSDQAEARFLAGETLSSKDWMSGDRLWLMDVVAPYGQGSAAKMIKFWHDGLKSDVEQYQFARLSRRGGDARHYTANRLPSGRFGSRMSLMKPKAGKP